MPIRVYFLNLRRKQKIAAVVLGICLLLALAGAAFWLCIPIPAGVTADGLSLSGLSYLHARTLLKQELDKTLYTQPLKIALPEETLTLSPEDCGVKVSLCGVLKAARGMKQGGELPQTDTFAVIGATIADNFGVAMPQGCIGTSLLERL